MKSQLERIRSHLRKHKKIDPITALDRYSVYRLSARVLELRQLGMNIRTDHHKGSRMAIYRLA